MRLMIFFLLLAPFAEARSDGNWLMKKCAYILDDNVTDPNARFSNLFCFGYIQGVTDSRPVDVGCFGENVTMGQIHRVVMKFLTDHPEALDKSASFLIQEALSKAFPCKASGNSP